MSRLIFPQWTETLKKWVSLLAIGAPVYLVVLIWSCAQNPNTLRIGYQPDQPVPYSHALHAGELGMDCRYCHSTVERGAKAAIPPAATCMNCHSVVWKDSQKLLPVRQAFYENEPLKWRRVHDLPDYVYFNHSAHVTRGVGCETCHGRIDQMVQVYQYSPLTMQWCIDCHRDPEPILRDPKNVTVMGYDDEKNPIHRMPGEGAQIMRDNKIHPPTDCSTCHR
jgi:hypothetical protein